MPDLWLGRSEKGAANSTVSHGFLENLCLYNHGAGSQAVTEVLTFLGVTPDKLLDHRSSSTRTYTVKMVPGLLFPFNCTDSYTAFYHLLPCLRTLASLF